MAKAYSLLLFCVLVWGSNFVIGKLLLESFSPGFTTFARFLAIVLALYIYGKWNGISFHFPKLTKKNLLVFVLLSTVGVFINQWSFFIGLQHADSTSAAVILAMTPLITCILAAIFLHEVFTKNMAIGLIVAAIGVFIVVGSGYDGTFLKVEKGLWWIAITMVTFSLLIILTRLLSKRMEAFSLTFHSNVLAFIISIPFAVLEEEKAITAAPGAWILLIVTAIIVHGFCNLIWNKQIKYINASKASTLTNLEPFVAMILGFFLLSKPILMTQVIGAIFIVCGVILSNKKRSRRYAIT
ncbi:DMT family transporter [Sutcliffiella horikoshii]|uniref:DMT family transporter n=1 Tax=Sutcliffiella horikoshii TaxID=79883 RepID=UPI001CBAC48F|nr:DMT family transporter [Sutcliffiella horikoshii]UAL48365.1 DMT family transporter [Sutcliffiella horikoshii]